MLDGTIATLMFSPGAGYFGEKKMQPAEETHGGVAK